MFIFVIPGIIAYALTQDVNSNLNITESGATLPELIKHLLPTGVRGLVAAGILSALMSSLSSVFNSCSTLITIDIYKKFKPKEKEQNLVKVGQIATGLLVIIGLLWIPFQESLSKGGLFKYIQGVQAYISPPIAAVFLFGLFFKRINSSGAMSALYLGAFLGLNRLVLEIDGSYVGSNLSGILPWFVNMHFLHFALFLFIVCSLTMFIVSYMTPKPDYKKISDVVYNKKDKEDNNHKKTDKKLINKADKFYTEIGMKTLKLKKELPGYLSDRLQESMWRESLHIINEDYASTKDLDEAIIYGPGLRWSLMGIFLTFHLAGGKMGMEHMLEQFAPALKLPWTKLKAPSLTNSLKKKIIQGTKSQSKNKSVNKLTNLRDNYLIELLKLNKKYKI